MPQRKHYLFVCTNRRPEGNPKGSCAANGSEEVLTALKTELAERGLAHTEIRGCGSTCMDLCWVGPVIAVEPDGFFYGRVQLKDIPEIVDALQNGTRVERLVLPQHDFDLNTARPRRE